MSFDLTQKIKVVNPTSNIDELYGPYTSVANALTGVPVVLRQLGRTVGIIEGGTIKEYWFKNGITDIDLVVKDSGGETDNIQKVIEITLTDLQGITSNSSETEINEAIALYLRTSNIEIMDDEILYIKVLGYETSEVDTIQPYKTITSNTYVDNSFHNSIILVKESVEITFPKNLREDLNFVCRAFSEKTVTFSFLAGTTNSIESHGTTLEGGQMCSIVTNGQNNYILTGTKP